MAVFTMTTVLVVEDDEAILKSYAFLLQKRGFKVTPVASAQEALTMCASQQFDAIVLDMLMPEMSGIEFLRQANLKQTAPQTKVLVLTNTESDKVRAQALALGATEYQLKVASTPQLLAEHLEVLTKSQSS
jgi:two-component system alkaline phosphatase synthesis response regulator PhoP